MIAKKLWLSIALNGTNDEQLCLMQNLHMCGNGKYWPETTFVNTKRGFFAEQVAEMWLMDRQKEYGLDFWFDPDNKWVYEKDDKMPKAKPDGTLITKDGHRKSFDVKTSFNPTWDKRQDGSYLLCRNAHDADYVLFYDISEEGIAQLFILEKTEDPEWYKLLGDPVDVTDLEEDCQSALAYLYHVRSVSTSELIDLCYDERDNPLLL